MRDIKFRTWQKMPISSDFYMEYNPSLEYGEAYINEAFIEQDRDLHKGRVFMQYTGRNDKNGIEVYEGDIITYESVYGGSVVAEIEFRYGSFNPKGVVGWGKHGSAEVIGNIYESPELLEEGKHE